MSKKIKTPKDSKVIYLPSIPNREKVREGICEIMKCVEDADKKKEKD